MSFTWGVGVNVLLCPTSANGVRIDVKCYLVNGLGCMELSVQLRGSFNLYAHFGKITSLGLVFMIVHRRCTGSLAPNIIRRDTMNKLCSDMDWIPVRV